MPRESSETLETRAYWVTRPGAGELRAEGVPADPGPGRSLVRAALSGISAGTERLVGTGCVPARGAEAMACAYMGGDFGLPVKYGYCLVGRAVRGALEGERVFVMHPHQELAPVRDEDATVIPRAVPFARALLVPNLETALNAVWDAELAPTERTLVVGAGSVGALVGHVLAHEPARGEPLEHRCTIVDPDPERRDLGAALPGVERALTPEELGSLEPGTFDVAFHASGNPAGLQAALDAVGFEGRVVELSWYGSKRVELDLGLAFHAQRKRLLASQVGCVAPSKRGTTTKEARLARVLELLEDESLDRLLGAPIAFEQLPAFMGELYAGRPLDARVGALPAVRYDEEAAA